MRSYRRTAARRRGGNDGSFWLSFSDLMSSLVLIIILVMFYIIYQYFNMAEVSETEIALRQSQLDQTQATLEEKEAALSEAERTRLAQKSVLDAQQLELEGKQTELDEKQRELDAANEVLNARQTELDAANAQLSSAQAQLALQQSELSSAQAQLESRERELSSAQAQLDSAQVQLQSQQTQLENQQAQIEQLVGMRTRIISSLSDALRGSSISATVDSATGSITLESDVLFATGRYELTAAGRRFVDRFLPVYLNVLFSAEYRDYVSEIIIEGHTDSDGGYLSNLELSQQRALAVASYVLGDCRAVSNDVKDQLRKVMTVNGRSFSDRIFKADGTEDMDASRRVVFKFRLTDEQMIQQLRNILEGEEE